MTRLRSRGDSPGSARTWPNSTSSVSRTSSGAVSPISCWARVFAASVLSGCPYLETVSLSRMPRGLVIGQAASFRGAVSGGVTGHPWLRHAGRGRGQTGAMAREQRHDGGTELGRFLYARRTQITPAEVGFTPGAGVRRTPGLRREEVAALAGVSIDYYTRLERGKETRPSPAVADALARALKLDPDEHEHLPALAARAARYAPSRRPHPAIPCGHSSSSRWRPCARTRPTSPAGPWTCSPPTPARWPSTPASATGRPPGVLDMTAPRPTAESAAEPQH